MLSRLLSERFKRPIYWNEYKVIPVKIYAANQNIRIKERRSCSQKLNKYVTTLII